MGLFSYLSAARSQHCAKPYYQWDQMTCSLVVLQCTAENAVLVQLSSVLSHKAIDLQQIIENNTPKVL